MAVEILEIFENNIDSRKLQTVVDCLKDGGVIIYPTDTVYAMGCDIFSTKAMERLSKIKGLKNHKNLAFICNDLSHIADYAKVENQAFRIMKKALPGPYTFILEATNAIPKLLQSAKKEIGIRVPDHAVPRAIVEALGHPIITTSIKEDDDIYNEYPNEIEWIYDRYKHEVDLIISGSWCGNIPSTVVSLIGGVELIREGLGDFSEL
jgi:tRNA threonylcarbamoyl adenosine modification protein (Sua5/YciO/YrdC/YwlC family)